MSEGISEIKHMVEFYDRCALGKQNHLSFPQVSLYRARHTLEVIHTDLCGSITPSTSRSRKYFILVVDDFTHYMCVEVLHSNDEALSFFRKIKATIDTERECKLIACV
jgi:hypothetical protein